jgi:hypothetical protein
MHTTPMRWIRTAADFVPNPIGDRVMMAERGRLADGPELFADVGAGRFYYINGKLERQARTAARSWSRDLVLNASRRFVGVVEVLVAEIEGYEARS